MTGLSFGYGIGLPLSRLHAKYLGGALDLVSLPGYGVDVSWMKQRGTCGAGVVGNIGVGISVLKRPKMETFWRFLKFCFIQGEWENCWLHLIHIRSLLVMVGWIHHLAGDFNVSSCQLSSFFHLLFLHSWSRPAIQLPKIIPTLRLRLWRHFHTFPIISPSFHHTFATEETSPQPHRRTAAPPRVALRVALRGLPEPSARRDGSGGEHPGRRRRRRPGVAGAQPADVVRSGAAGWVWRP